MSSLYKTLTLPVRFLATRTFSKTYARVLSPEREFHHSSRSPVRARGDFSSRTQSRDSQPKNSNTNPLDIIMGKQGPENSVNISDRKMFTSGSAVGEIAEGRGRRSMRNKKIKRVPRISEIRSVSRSSLIRDSSPRETRRGKKPAQNKNRNKSNETKEVKDHSTRVEYPLALRSISFIEEFQEGNISSIETLANGILSPRKVRSEVITTETSNIPWQGLSSMVTSTSTDVGFHVRWSGYPQEPPVPTFLSGATPFTEVDLLEYYKDYTSKYM